MQEKREIEELIANLLSGNISSDERDVLSSWLNESADNRIHFAQMKSIWDAAHPAFHPEEIDVVSAKADVLDRINVRNWTHSPVIIWWQRVAAIIILPFIMFMGYYLFNEKRQSIAIAYQEISSPYGVTSKVNLSDGSVVWLNSGSKLKYPVTFTSDKRVVHLSGEAYFKVHSDKSHPFVVTTDNVNVTATGTQFNVEAYATDTITAITLMEGKVDVNLPGNKSEHLKPNQRIVLNTNSNTYNLGEIDAQQLGAWKDGILVFRDEPLEEVFKRISRTYNVNISVKDPIIGQQLYRATFQGESLEEILRLLKMSAPIKYKRIGREKRFDNEYNKEQIDVYRVKE